MIEKIIQKMIYELSFKAHEDKKINSHSCDAQETQQRLYALNKLAYSEFGVDYAKMWLDRQYNKSLEQSKKKVIVYEVRVDE